MPASAIKNESTVARTEDDSQPCPPIGRRTRNPPLFSTALHSRGPRPDVTKTRPRGPTANHRGTEHSWIRPTPLLLSLLATLPLSAQSASTAGLRGRILDRDGTPVETALVTLIHTRTGVTSTALSVADGRYTLRGQRPGGPYTVTVTRLGFREFTREDIEPLLGQFVDLDVTLVPDAIEIEALVVEAEPDPEFNPGVSGSPPSSPPRSCANSPPGPATSSISRRCPPLSAPPRRAYRWPAPATASTPQHRRRAQPGRACMAELTCKSVHFPVRERLDLANANP